MKSITYPKLYEWSWLICAATLPWSTSLNRFSLIVLTVVWLANGQLIKKWERIKSRSWAWLFIAFFGIHVGGLFFTENTSNGLFELEKKLTLLLLPLIAITGENWGPSTMMRLRTVFIYSCLAAVIWNLGYGIFFSNIAVDAAHNFDMVTHSQFHALNPTASAWWEYLSYIQIGKGTGLHPTYFSMYLVFCCVILLHKMNSSYNKIIDFILFLFFTAFILLMTSRAAILSYLILTFFLIAQNAYQHKKIALGAFRIFACSLLVALGIWVNPVTRFRVIQEPLITNFEITSSLLHWNSINLRLLEWKGSWDAIKKNSAMGTGTGDGRDALTGFYKNFSETTTKIEYDPHNQFLQTTLELGIVGLLSLLACLYFPVHLRKFETLHLLFVLLLIIMCFTECILERQKGIVFFALFQSAFMSSKSTA